VRQEIRSVSPAFGLDSGSPIHAHEKHRLRQTDMDTPPPMGLYDEAQAVHPIRLTSSALLVFAGDSSDFVIKVLRNELNERLAERVWNGYRSTAARRKSESPSSSL